MPDKLNKADKAVITTSILSGIATTAASVMSTLGFSSAGIAAGSTAAGLQAGVGNVVAGSAFATAQSLGAIGAYTWMGVTGGVGLTIGAVYAGYKYFKPQPKL